MSVQRWRDRRSAYWTNGAEVTLSDYVPPRWTRIPDEMLPVIVVLKEREDPLVEGIRAIALALHEGRKQRQRAHERRMREAREHAKRLP